MKKIITTSLATMMLFTANVAHAEEEKSRDEKEKELESELETNLDEQKEIDDKVVELDAKIKETEKNIEKTEKDIEDLAYDIKITEQEIVELIELTEYNEEMLGERLKVIDSNYSLDYLQIILDSESISDFFNNVYIVKEVVEQDKELLAQLENSKLVLQEKQAGLEASKKTQESLMKSLESQTANLESEKEELKKLKKELEDQEAEIEAEIFKLTSQVVVQPGEVGAVITSGSWPAPGVTRISSPYGYRIHPIFGTRKMHTGIDIAGPMGSSITSYDDGKVIFSGWQNGYGNTVMVQHNDGKVTLYAHNSQNMVKVGQTVKKGQLIAKMGSTGNSTGSHLHFEIRINGSHVNPMNYL